MESTASNTPTLPPPDRLADRILRALTHNLRLLDRHSPSHFSILGATGNVYSITLSTTPSCTCPDRTVPCKHILFVYLRVLDLPLSEPFIRRRALRACELKRVLSTQSSTSKDVVASDRARARFHQVAGKAPAVVEMRRRSGPCPVCLEVMEEGVVVCGTCGNGLHEECLARWKRTRGRRAATCVMCRSRWRSNKDQEMYVNLAAYVGREEDGGTGMCM